MDARFTLDARGTLKADDAEGQKRLPQLAGSYFLARTSADLMCLIRTPSVGGQVVAPRVVLCGDASAFPVSDLIAFVSQARWSGVIRVHGPSGDRSVGFKDGEVRGATSDDPMDRLGEVIVRLGYCDHAQIEEVLQEYPPSKIGRALVDAGVLQAHDLWKCITDQVSEIFHAIVLSREGAFMLVDQEWEDKSGHNIQFSTQSLLMDAIRKIDEMGHFRKRIPHGRMYVGKKRGSDGKLEEDEDKVLGLVTGQRTVLALGQAAKLSEFDVTKVIFRLLEGGYAVVSDAPVPASAPASVQAPRPQPTPAPETAPTGGRPQVASSGTKSSDPRGVIRVFNLIFREIRDEVAKQSMEKEFLASANAALSGQALSSSPVLADLAFDPSGGLPEVKVFEAFERVKGKLGSEPVASLRQALSEVMFFLLFQAGELLESRADEDLARRVKEMLATIEGE